MPAPSALSAALLLAAAVSAAPAPRAVPIELPGGKAGIGFDDLLYAPRLKKLLAPGGRTGRIHLVDPKDRSVTPLGGFSARPDYGGGHDDGVTSADECLGFLVAPDRTALTLSLLDPVKGSVVASAPLGASPDYVRCVTSAREAWVSEPDREQIEVFAVSSGAEPALTRAAVIAVPGGPESLVIDAARGKAYTHLWKGKTVAVDLRTRAVGAPWRNGCAGSRGIALDEARGYVFAGCSEGKGTVMDAADGGKLLSSLSAGDGVDVIDYDPVSGHLYLPGARSATMAIVRVGARGTLTLAATVDTALHAHCVASDHRGGVYVCDPDAGRLLFFADAAGRRAIK